MSNPHSWEVTWSRQSMQEAAAKVTAYEKASGKYESQLIQEGDVEYLKLERIHLLHKTFYMQDQIRHLAYAEREKKHRALGKQYGIASETIRKLKGEVAILKVKLSESRDDSRKNRLRAVKAERKLEEIERRSHLNDRL